MPFTYSSANVKSVLTALVSAAMLKLVSMTLLRCSIILPCASTLDWMMASMAAGAMRAVLVDVRGAFFRVVRGYAQTICACWRERDASRRRTYNFWQQTYYLALHRWYQPWLHALYCTAQSCDWRSEGGASR